jgi:Holliday junction resolvase RusA-like endonuclease
MNDVTGFEENGWKLLHSSDVPVEIWSEFQSDAPNIKVFKEWLLGEYFKQSGINIDIDSAAHQELKGVAAWLGFQQANSGLVLNFRRHPRLQAVFYPTYSDKIMTIAQRHCNVCRAGRTPAEMVPVHTLSLPINPMSRQTKKNRSRTFKAFKKAIKEHFLKRNVSLGSTGRFCLAITFVLNARKKDKDLDNMTKALLDALAEAIGFNDSHVHHLDIIKLVFPDVEERIFVHLAPAALNEHLDVILPITHFSKIGHYRIEPADFMERAPKDA